MHHHRRRKKRPNYGTRAVVISRGCNGFGFTISGQQPCILSCIVSNSPADLAGLRAGDFLISVNGLNVSKLPHEAVVQLIGNAIGTIQMCIAENYYSDSSDEDPAAIRNKNRQRPKYPHHKIKLNRSGNGNCLPVNRLDLVKSGSDLMASPAIVDTSASRTDDILVAAKAAEQSLQSTAHNIIHSPNGSNKNDIFNVSAMVCSGTSKSINDTLAIGGNDLKADIITKNAPVAQQQKLEYRTVVGYLGTIEMPKQIATSSKLQTVRSCIRKMRQEKRNPAIVLMTIVPTCLMLRNSNNILMAKYPTSRLSYVSSSSETDNRFFGLVTSAIYADGQMCESAADVIPHRNDVVISNSCHVFVIDFKLSDHSQHLDKAGMFQIDCTQDPISNLCLEFPSNSEYVVNLIRSMYTLRSVGNCGGGQSSLESCAVASVRSRVVRQLNMDVMPGGGRRNGRLEDVNDGMIANSPQPSNHSEITTTSSNSDSGIGFHNDYTNILDRILVVDFPVLQHRQIANVRGNVRTNQQQQPVGHPRPSAIVNEVPASSSDFVRNIRSTVDVTATKPSPVSFPVMSSAALHQKSKSMDLMTISEPIDPEHTNPKLSIRVLGDALESNATINTDTPQSHYETIFCRSADIECRQEHDDFQERPVDVPKRFELLDLLRDFKKQSVVTSRKSLQLAAARSCDDMRMCEFETRTTDSSTTGETAAAAAAFNRKILTGHQSFENFVEPKAYGKNQRSPSVPNDHTFLHPAKPANKRARKLPTKRASSDAVVPNDRMLSYKLSPKVFGVLRPSSASVEDLTGKLSGRRLQDHSVWGSLQELSIGGGRPQIGSFAAGTYSEPDIAVSRTFFLFLFYYFLLINFWVSRYCQNPYSKTYFKIKR